MADIKQINDVIIKGINNFTTPYNQPAENIQIIFRLSEEKKLLFQTCVNQQRKEEKQLQQLIGNNWWNFQVKTHIRGLLNMFIKQSGLSEKEINLMAGVKAGDHVYVWLRNGDQLIRQVEAEELK